MLSSSVVALGYDGLVRGRRVWCEAECPYVRGKVAVALVRDEMDDK